MLTLVLDPSTLERDLKSMIQDFKYAHFFYLSRKIGDINPLPMILKVFHFLDSSENMEGLKKNDLPSTLPGAAVCQIN